MLVRLQESEGVLFSISVESYGNSSSSDIFILHTLGQHIGQYISLCKDKKIINFYIQINIIELSKSTRTSTQRIQYQFLFYVLFQINMKLPIEKLKLVNVGGPKPRISKFNHVFCRIRLKILYRKRAFCLNLVARRDIFMLNNVQNILSNIFRISKVVKIMVKKVNFVANKSTKPFNTNQSFLKQQTFSLIIMLEKVMKFSGLCCF